MKQVDPCPSKGGTILQHKDFLMILPRTAALPKYSDTHWRSTTGLHGEVRMIVYLLQYCSTLLRQSHSPCRIPDSHFHILLCCVFVTVPVASIHHSHCFVSLVGICQSFWVPTLTPGCWIVVIRRSVEICVRWRDNFHWKIRAHTLVIVIVEGGGGRYPSKQIQIVRISIGISFFFASASFSTPQPVLHNLWNAQSMNNTIVATLASLQCTHWKYTQRAIGASH